MTGLPNIGEKVRIWRSPDRGRVQDGPRPVDHFGGGKFLGDEGKEVRWSEFLLEQLRSGDIMLHPPPGASPAKAEVPLADLAEKPKKKSKET